MTVSGKTVYKGDCANIFTVPAHCAGLIVIRQSLTGCLREGTAFFTLLQVQVRVHYGSKSYSWLCLIDISISRMNTNGIKCRDWPQIEYETSFASTWEGEQGF